MNWYLPKLYSSYQGIKVEIEPSYYVTKSDVRKAASVDTSSFPKIVGFASIKADIDKLNIDKFKSAPTSLNNLKLDVDKIDITKVQTALNNIVKNDIVKKTWFYRLK